MTDPQTEPSSDASNSLGRLELESSFASRILSLLIPVLMVGAVGGGIYWGLQALLDRGTDTLHPVRETAYFGKSHHGPRLLLHGARNEHECSRCLLTEHSRLLLLLSRLYLQTGTLLICLTGLRTKNRSGALALRRKFGLHLSTCLAKRAHALGRILSRGLTMLAERLSASASLRRDTTAFACFHSGFK